MKQTQFPARRLLTLLTAFFIFASTALAIELSPGEAGLLFDRQMEGIGLKDDDRTRDIDGSREAAVRMEAGEQSSDEAAGAILLSDSGVPENRPAGRIVGELSIVHADEDGAVQFDLAEGEGDGGNDAFFIDGNFLRTAIVFDYDLRNSYSVRVKATDSDGLEMEEMFLLDVIASPPPDPAPGTPDASFSTVVSLDSGISAAAQQEDGKWLVAWTPGGQLSRLNADGSPDESFMEGMGDPNGQVHAIAVQPDGNILVAGSFSMIDGRPAGRIARLHADGTLDETFRSDFIGYLTGTIVAIGLQEDGRIVVGGSLTPSLYDDRIHLARLHPDGTLDDTFADGVSGPDHTVHSVVLQTDGRIVIGGRFSNVNGTPRGRVARLHPDGSVDTTFGDDLPLVEGSRVEEILVQPDGKILVGGQFDAVNGEPRNHLARLASDGHLDFSFAAGLSGPNATVETIALQEEGEIIVGGSFTAIHDEPRNRLARLHPDGALDTTFETAGIHPNNTVRSAKVLDDGRIFIAGHFSWRAAILHGGELIRPPTDVLLTNTSVAEHQPEGTIVGFLSAINPEETETHTFTLSPGEGSEDNDLFVVSGNVLKTSAGFDHQAQESLIIRVRATDSAGLFAKTTFTITVTPVGGGLVVSTFDPASPIQGPIRAVARQPDGKWIIGGEFEEVGGEVRRGVARLLPDGALDVPFLDGLSGVSGDVYAAAVQQDGKILIGGDFHSVNGVTRGSFARLNADGSLDESFGYESEGANGDGPVSVNAIVLLDSGKILLGGRFTLFDGEPRNGIVRLNSDGTLNATFVPEPVMDYWDVRSVAVQEDGRILLAGELRTPTGAETHRNIARLDADGTIDSSFGLVETGGAIESMALQNDGRIVIGGWFEQVNDEPRNRIARLNTDGTLDSAFGDGLSGVEGDNLPRVYSILLQADGRILIGGEFSTVNEEPRSRLARLNADGTVDATFGHGMAGANAPIHALTPAAGGMVAVAGAFTEINGVSRDRMALINSAPPPADIFLSRTTVAENQAPGAFVGKLTAIDPDTTESHIFLLVSGEGDEGNSFFSIEDDALKTAATLDRAERSEYSIRVQAVNTAGRSVERTFKITVLAAPEAGFLHVDRSFDPGSSINGTVRAAAQQDDGKWIIGGDFTTVHGETRAGIARLHADGSTDVAFMPSLSGANGRVLAVVVQQDGKILVGGEFTEIHGAVRRGIARLNADGSLDESFGKGMYGAHGGSVQALLVQDDGNIVIGGSFHSVNAQSRGRLARLNPDGSLADNLGSSGFGWAGGSSTGEELAISALAVQEDGKLLIGGTFTLINSTERNRIARLHPDGRLDTSFGAGMAGANRRVHSIVIQENGKILIGGAFWSVNGVSQPRITRLNTDGSLDTLEWTGFTGIQTAGDVSPVIESISLTSDGGILIGGHFNTLSGETRNRIARLNSDGTLDTAFGDGLAGANGRIHAILTGDDGTIFIGGDYTTVNGIAKVRVGRLHADGTLDESFDNGPGGADWILQTVVPQDDGKVLLGGGFSNVRGQYRPRLARLNPDGTLDADFGAAGETSSSVNAVAVQRDGRILVGGGFTQVFGEPASRLAWLNPDGTSAGELPRLSAGRVRAIEEQPDGRILFAGDFTDIGGEPRGRIARLNTDGTLDSSFGGSEAGAGNGAVLAVALQDDGRILIGGTFTTVHEEPRNRIARLNPDGTLDPKFAVGLSGLSVSSIVVQPDGKILIGGTFDSVNGEPRGSVARLNPDGAIDSTFGDGWTGAENPVSPVIHSVALQADGRILVGGRFTVFNGEARNRLARLHRDGTLDQTLTGADDYVRSVTVQPDGDILVAGAFTMINGVPRDRVARLHGGARPADRGPTDILLSNDAITEHRPEGTEVGILSAIDPDEGTHTFELAGGEGAASNSLFEIDGTMLVTAAVLEYAEGTEHSIRVRATAMDGLSVERVLTIYVLPNQPPTEIVLSNATIPEHRPIGSEVGTLSAFDPDEDDVHVFELVSGAGDEGNALFAIHETSLVTDEVLDYETQTTHAIRVRAIDLGGLYVEQNFTIIVERDSFRAWSTGLPNDERGEGDDPGGFGIPNLLRYAFDMDPVQPRREKLPEAGTVVVTDRRGEMTYLTITYTRRTDDDLLRYFVEGSNDLVSWSELLRAREDIADDGNGFTETVTVRDTVSLDSGAKRFLRVRVER